MTQAAQQLVEDTTSDAPRRVLQAVLLQAISDIEATIAPNATPGTVTRIQNNRKDAENFFWGADTRVCDNYLVLLGYNPTRFKNDLKARLQERATVTA